mmetsp:Transcript_20223/g.23429  ORF Transcript_20223/g.23429 Transcript_20223/m.23429 type:complete len:461 (-) Transcript_20223:83-1465(-)
MMVSSSSSSSSLLPAMSLIIPFHLKQNTFNSKRPLKSLVISFYLASSSCHSIASSTSPSTTSSSSLSSNTIVSGGLINLGNTCYLNAQLECAYHIPKVRNLILDPSSAKIPLQQPSTDEDENENNDTSLSSFYEPEPEPNASLLSLQHVFKSMNQASQRGNGDPLFTQAVSTSILCRNLGINVYAQQDSQEFWKLLLPGLNHNHLTNLYKGEYENYIVALDGTKRERKRKEIFLDLSLDVTNFDNVYDSLDDKFTSARVLSVKEGNGWRPEKGAEKVDALKGCTIQKSGLPPLLQLHLMRFKYDIMREDMSKINDRFVFPKKMDLTQICEENEGEENSSDDKGKVIYDLQSIVIHSGEYGSGHYYAYVRPDVRKNKWYRYDDDRVDEVTFKMVKDDAYGGHVVGRTRQSNGGNDNNNRGFWRRIIPSMSRRRLNFGWGGKSSSAYMLQYVKRSDVPSIYA